MDINAFDTVPKGTCKGCSCCHSAAFLLCYCRCLFICSLSSMCNNFCVAIRGRILSSSVIFITVAGLSEPFSFNSALDFGTSYSRVSGLWLLLKEISPVGMDPESIHKSISCHTCFISCRLNIIFILHQDEQFRVFSLAADFLLYLPKYPLPISHKIGLICFFIESSPVSIIPSDCIPFSDMDSIPVGIKFSL